MWGTSTLMCQERIERGVIQGCHAKTLRRLCRLSILGRLSFLRVNPRRHCLIAESSCLQVVPGGSPGICVASLLSGHQPGSVFMRARISLTTCSSVRSGDSTPCRWSILERVSFLRVNPRKHCLIAPLSC